MICSRCNEEIAEGSKFCPKCGNSLNGDNNVIDEPIKKGKKSKLPLFLLLICACIIAGALCVYNSQPSVKFANAEKAYAKGNYSRAVKLYTAVGDYEGADKKLKDALIAFHYHEGLELFEKEQYSSALEEFSESGIYENTKELKKQCNYYIGKDLYEKNEFLSAAESLGKADGYEDAESIILSMGKQLLENNNYEDAVKVYDNASGWANDNYARYANGILHYNNGDYLKASTHFEHAGDVLDAKDKFYESTYLCAKKQLDEKKYEDAIISFEKIKDYEDSSNMIGVCNLLIARQEIKAGNLNTAKNYLSTVSDEVVYEDIKASDLKELLNKNKHWVNLSGKWVTTSGKAKTTSSYDRFYHEQYWEHEFSPGDYSVELVCALNDDGSVSIKGHGSVFIITNYSSITAGLRHEVKKFNINTTVNKLGTIKIDEHTTLTLSADKIVLNYKKTEKEVAYFTYIYTANCTYGKKTESF